MVLGKNYNHQRLNHYILSMFFTVEGRSLPFFFVIQFNQGQSSGPAGVDVNVVPVWRSGITGRGVVVSILDDGKLANRGCLPFT